MRNVDKQKASTVRKRNTNYRVVKKAPGRIATNSDGCNASKLKRERVINEKQ